ncbi:MAG: YbaK/EbsC family protein, partial [Chloroflexota bacterium]|nr:YbaK/EbsC family protein [Chloroflexota bacterium]
MHPNVARVVEAARHAGLQIEVERFPEGTRTAVDAALAVGCEVAQIVKSLVFVADEAPVVALVSGANRVDLDRLAAAVDAAGARRADGDEARAATG